MINMITDSLSKQLFNDARYLTVRSRSSPDTVVVSTRVKRPQKPKKRTRGRCVILTLLLLNPDACLC